MTATHISCVVADEERRRGTAAEHARAIDTGANDSRRSEAAAEQNARTINTPANDSRRSEAAAEQAHVLAAADALLA